MPTQRATVQEVRHSETREDTDGRQAEDEDDEQVTAPDPGVTDRQEGKDDGHEDADDETEEAEAPVARRTPAPTAVSDVDRPDDGSTVGLPGRTVR